MNGTRLGEIIRTARKQAGLRLEDVADRVGVTAGALSHIESGRRLPSPHNAVRIAEVLGIPSEDVLTALDAEHSSRRRGSIDGRSHEQGRSPATYSELPIEALFSGSRAEVDAVARADRGPQSRTSAPRRMAAPGPGSVGGDAALHRVTPRAMARWSDVTAERITALDALATTAAEAIRTLRGLVDDEDPAVAHEAARLLRELDVRSAQE